jgi:hypothetical protein
MLIPFLIVIIILSLGILYTCYVHRYTNNNILKLDKTDILILMMVFMSFLTEIIFIFVLVMRYVYVSDMDMIIFFMTSGIGNMLIPTYSPFALPTYAPYAPYTYPPFKN